MASVRLLKKDVNYITNEIIIECFTLEILFPNKNKEELTKIIADTIHFQSNTIKAINSAATTSSKPIKNQFTNIKTKMKAEINQLVDRLEKLS